MKIIGFKMDLKLILFSISYLVCESFGLKVDVEGSQTIADMDDMNATLVLNCSFTEEAGETIETDHSIIWKTGSGDSIAGFSMPGGKNPEYYIHGEYLRNKSELINPTENSSSALIIINEIMCEDEKSYKCTVTYQRTGHGRQEGTSTEISFSLRKSAKRPLDIPLISASELQENEDMHFSCETDVGKPPGIVKWWRFRTDNDFTLIKESDQIPDEAGNCEFVSSVNITYRVTKDDNRAFFRCTSHNNISKDEGPEDTLLYRDTVKINVLYEAMILNVILLPESDVYPVSTPRLNMTCIADGNPLPTADDYRWTFQSFHSNTTEEKQTNGKFLILQNLQEKNSGIYTCSVTNSLNSTHSWNVSIIVNGTIPEPQAILLCLSNPCGALENCVELGQEYKCETNALGVVGVVFLVVTIPSLAVSFGLAYYIRKLNQVSKIGVQKVQNSNGNATAYPMTGTESDLKNSALVLSDETNGAIYAQIKKS